jgi:hypothetical protein
LGFTKERHAFATAEIVRVEEIRSYTSPEANFYPIVKFSDQNGEIHEYRAGRSKKGQYKEGQKAKIYYDSKNPERVILKGIIKRSMRAFLIVLGLGLIVALCIYQIAREIRLKQK